MFISMSYLTAAMKDVSKRRSVTFRYKNTHFPTMKEVIPKSYQVQCEIIRDCLSDVTMKNFKVNGCVLKDFSLADANMIENIMLIEDDNVVELYIDTRTRPYRLRINEGDLDHIENVSTVVEINYRENIGSAIISPGKTFS